MQDKENQQLFLDKGIRNTRQRNLVLDVLKQGRLPLTAEEIHSELRKENDAINLSTVYRTLEVFVEKGLASKTYLADNNRAAFELERMEHKHHLICVYCKRIETIVSCPLHEFEKEVARKTRFHILSHQLHMYGCCPECSESEGVAAENETV